MSEPDATVDGITLVATAPGDDNRPQVVVAALLEVVPDSGRDFLAPDCTITGHDQLYGGQLAAQALRAASLTVPADLIAHSMHAYFLQRGNPKVPIRFRVQKEHDGRSRSVRHIIALQRDEPIFTSMCSFARPRSGPLFHGVATSAVAAPDSLPSYSLGAGSVFDVAFRIPGSMQPTRGWPAQTWVKICEPLGDDPNVQACGVVFLSDMGNGLSAGAGMHLVSLMTSLDHSVWLHQSGRADDWLLLDLSPLAGAGGRGVYTGHVFDRDGVMIASLAQESLFRVRGS